MNIFLVRILLFWDLWKRPAECDIMGIGLSASFYFKIAQNTLIELILSDELTQKLWSMRAKSTMFQSFWKTSTYEWRVTHVTLSVTPYLPYF